MSASQLPASLLDQMSDAFYSLGFDWHFTYLNRQACEVLGQPASAIIGTYFWDQYPETRDMPFNDVYRRVMATRVSESFEVDFPRFGGWFEVRVHPSSDGIAVFFQDINKRKAIQEKIRFQARLLDIVEQAVIATDLDGIVLFWNRFAEVLYGWPADQALGGNIHDLTVPAVSSEQADELMAQVAIGRNWSGEFEVRRKDGASFPAYVTNSPIVDDDGQVIGIVGISHDISDARRAKAALEASEARYRALVEHMPAATYIATLEGNVTYTSQQIEQLTGYTQAEWDSDPASWRSVIHPDDREQLFDTMARAIDTGETLFQEHRFIRRDGRTIWVRNQAVLVRDSQGEPSHIQGFIVDVTANKELESRLFEAATRDALTGLPNRTRFLQRARQSLDTARETGSTVAVLFLDLDNFKVINDSFGHSLGDELLVRIASLLRGFSRANEMVTRMGGDEFAVLVEGLSGQEEARAVAGRLLRVLETPLDLAGRQVVVSGSIGIVSSGDYYCEPADLLRDADIALHHAKRSGKNRYAVFEPAMYDEVERRLELEIDLRHAIANDEFFLYYQPEINLATGELIGVEALVRWQHPERGLILPDTFIPVAEECGLIIPLGAWILREACRQGAVWNQHSTAPVKISVNLASRQFAQPDLIDQLATVLAETGLPGELLTLEITESTVMDDARGAIERLQQLKALGVGLAVDDFGTGYSSLAYLKRFPVDALKIDRTFVAELDRNTEGSAIVTAIITLGHTLGLAVIAEGVETERQLRLLRALDCDYAQGYYFSRPVPAGEIGAMLEQAALQRVASQNGRSDLPIDSPQVAGLV